MCLLPLGAIADSASVHCIARHGKKIVRTCLRLDSIPRRAVFCALTIQYQSNVYQKTPQIHTYPLGVVTSHRIASHSLRGLYGL